MRVSWRTTAVAVPLTIAVVLSGGIPILRSTAGLAAAAEPVPCPVNSDDSSIPPAADSRCVAGLQRTTRGRALAVCLDSRALIQHVEYGAQECRPGWGVQVEGIAHSRAIMRLNEAGYAGDTAAVGVTPNIQWEVIYPSSGSKRAGRVDILLYDRSVPNAPIELIEVKQTGRDDPRTQLARYISDFPTATPDQPVTGFDLAGYQDEFSVVTATCEQGASEREVRDYLAHPDVVDGILLVDLMNTRRTPCNGGDTTEEPTEEPAEEEEPTEEPVERDRPPIRVVPPGYDDDDDGQDDFFEIIRREFPEWAPGDLPELVPDLDLEPIFVDYKVFVAIAGVVMLCVVLPGCGVPLLISAIESVWPILGTANGLTTLGTALSTGFLALLGLLGINLWGDPHFVTLDGLTYDLQSVGEFHLLEVSERFIDVQARFKQGGSNVSVMRRIAFQINGTEIELEGSVLRVNGVVRNLPASGYLDLGDGASLMRTDDQWLAVWPGYGDRLMMAFTGTRAGFHIPDGMTGVRGLLGNANDNPMDDLSTRDGSILPTVSTASALHGQFGHSWRVTDEETLFTYEAGESVESLSDLTFPSNVPSLDDFTPAQIADAEDACNLAHVPDGPQFDACVLDVAVTGDPNFAINAALVSGQLFDRFDPLCSAQIGRGYPLPAFTATGSQHLQQVTHDEPGLNPPRFGLTCSGLPPTISVQEVRVELPDPAGSGGTYVFLYAASSWGSTSANGEINVGPQLNGTNAGLPGNYKIQNIYQNGPSDPDRRPGSITMYTANYAQSHTYDIGGSWGPMPPAAKCSVQSYPGYTLPAFTATGSQQGVNQVADSPPRTPRRFGLTCTGLPPGLPLQEISASVPEAGGSGGYYEFVFASNNWAVQSDGTFRVGLQPDGTEAPVVGTWPVQAIRQNGPSDPLRKAMRLRTPSYTNSIVYSSGGSWGSVPTIAGSCTVTMGPGYNQPAVVATGSQHGVSIVTDWNPASTRRFGFACTGLAKSMPIQEIGVVLPATNGSVSNEYVYAAKSWSTSATGTVTVGPQPNGTIAAYPGNTRVLAIRQNGPTDPGSGVNTVVLHSPNYTYNVRLPLANGVFLDP